MDKCKKCKNGKCTYECKKATKIVELVIDDNNEQLAIDAISLVSDPAIDVEMIYMSKDKANITLAKVDEDKRLIISPALIPDKSIYRFNQETGEEYYVYFSKETVKKASEAYLKYNNQSSATLEHNNRISGVHTVESWIITNPDMDKSNLYGYDLPAGTWMVSMRVENDDVWQLVKDKTVKGLSIEGYYVDKMEAMSAQKLASYTDYPKAAKENAQRAIDANKELGNKCATQVGKVRAQQISQGKPLSLDTIYRVYSYLSRAAEYADGDYTKCGTISYNLWGGDEMLRYAERIVKEDAEQLSDEDILKALAELVDVKE